MKKKAIYGRRNVEEFITNCDWSQIKDIWVKESYYGEAVSSLLKDLPDKSLVKKKPGAELDKILNGGNHQGIVIWVLDKLTSSKNLGFAEWKAQVSPHEGPVLILDRIQDPGNLGNIIRTAECMGVKSIVIPDRGACGITDTVIKISSGALHHLNIYSVPNLSRVVDVLKENEYWIVATTDQGDEDWSALPTGDDIAIIMGNEGEGVKRLLLDESDYQMRIPLHGNISSMNVSVACGIVLDRIVNARY
ncbi:23S rRNA (guanosine(2251)-2'-O)-methyltransferase RlmB [Leptospira sp. GIMC2001]|uniref:23S rRNA (guanosine(2251)-2'-O)-methyltransferase RlmB n=1 Tax=Leptospira sp. GIMC2001 TaxID=1513297 RepID=UPI002349D307|nr:23S rRNA (guanosine(2251)-2'-O)-methyltransferase RlmB [Leptospira sp. GIMC2001]WCL48013.1 23S rRNA (guanosine(2251)-2'-O)-methyltransferase RlmB [Leptospira sp. GIMC2001]